MAITITKPTVGGSEDTWGSTINTALDTIVDAANGTTGLIEPNLTEGSWQIGSTAVTPSAADLNILDGLASESVTVTELGHLSGVTSDIQTQLDAKQVSNAILDDLSGLTQAANKIPYFNAADTASTLSFVDEDNMSSNSNTAVPSQQSVKAYVDANSGDSVTFSASGGQADVGGLQIRFGTFSSTTDNNQSVTFDTAFSTACLVVTTSFGMVDITSKTTTGFTANRLDEHASSVCEYIAIGH
tara:strand:- start:600 stop:1328 length:729 start_codon:yes stop_codon:yes gene_type:complete